MFMCMSVHVCVPKSMCLEVRGQLAKVDALHHVDPKDQTQVVRLVTVSLPTKPSCQPWETQY